VNKNNLIVFHIRLKSSVKKATITKNIKSECEMRVGKFQTFTIENPFEFLCENRLKFKKLNSEWLYSYNSINYLIKFII